MTVGDGGVRRETDDEIARREEEYGCWTHRLVGMGEGEPMLFAPPATCGLAEDECLTRWGWLPAGRWRGGSRP